MIDSDLEIYILEAKEKNKELKKISVLEQYKDIIFEMLKSGLNKKQVYNYLVLKYNLDTSYFNLTKWCKKHIKVEKQNINTVNKKESDELVENNKVRAAYNKHKPF